MAPPETPLRDIRDIKGEQPLRGARVANMSPALAEELNMDPFKKGVFILAIQRGTTANRLGFRRGDFVLAINDIPVLEVENLMQRLKEPVDRWRISVERDGKQRDLVINR